jgi:uncharacterized membrane protein YfcA
VHLIEFVLAGLGVGAFFGVFGAGGSAFATPILALMGVPGVLAIASPLPAMLPASLTGARFHATRGTFNRRVALLAIAGGVPGTAVGALISSALDGRRLLLLSGLMLLVVGVRVVWPSRTRAEATPATRHPGVLVAATFGVGLLTGLLANGGGFLLVPLFIVGFGLATGEAAGTSMLVVGVLTVPTLVTHWALGHIDWGVALAFGLGVVPGSLVGAHLSGRLPEHVARVAFGATLVVFALGFLARQLV